MALLKRVFGTLAALAVAGAAIVAVVAYLAQLSWAANPLRDQLNAEKLPDDPWVLSVGEREAIIDQLSGVVYNDSKTGQLKWIDTTKLDGWSVREPLRCYRYTGEALVQSSIWYYPVCYNDVVYVVVKAAAKDLPKGTDPVPPATDCAWSWELVRDQSTQQFTGWYSLNMAYAAGDNNYAVINTVDYAHLYTDGDTCGRAMWENTIHTAADDYVSIDFSSPQLFDGIEVADVYNSYPLT